MSIERVRALAQRLPPLMSDQVLGYAESVEMALPEIFEDARVPFNERVVDEVVMVAGIRKRQRYPSCRFSPQDLAQVRPSWSAR